MTMPSPDTRRNRKAASVGRPSQGVVLCPTDFSVHAAQAARVAALLAVKWGTRLHLVHVVDPSVLPKAATRALKDWLHHVRQQLDGEVERLKSSSVKGRLQISTEILQGRPENELVRYTEENKPWCVVMASIGQVAISRVLAGSVAERTAEAAWVPTLIVREEEALREWLEGKKTLQVFVAADFSAASEAALTWVKRLREAGPCEWTVGMMDWPPEAEQRYGFKGVHGSFSNRTEIQAALERDLQERVLRWTGESSARIRVEAGWGAPEFNLMQMATEERMDLFVVGTHQRQGLSRLFQPSVSRAVIHHAPMNVACVPVRFQPQPHDIPEVRRVLVTTDLSKLGNHAICRACSILPSGGLVRLVHVLPPYASVNPIPGHEEAGKLTGKGYAALKDRIRKNLDALIAEDWTPRGIRVETSVLEGTSVAKTVAQEAERMGADVICIGSHGRTGLLSLALGSVAQQVIGQSRKPVLVVRPESP